MKMNKIAFAVISVLCVFTFFSCDLLTKPLLEQIGLGDVLAYAPNAENLGNADTTVLANAAGDISIAADPVASKAVLEALGTKEEDEILDLSDEQKTNILSLTTSAILPVDQIIGIATDAMNQASSEENNGNGNNNSNNEDGMQTIIQNMVAAIPFVDTQATEYIILDEVDNMPTLNDGDATPENVPDILLATISVAISACKSNGDKTIDITTTAGQDAISDLLQNVFEDDSNSNNGTNNQTPAEIAEDILSALSTDGSTNEAGVRALTSALTVFKTLAEKNIQVSGDSLMGMLAGGMMN